MSELDVIQSTAPVESPPQPAPVEQTAPENGTDGAPETAPESEGAEAKFTQADIDKAVQKRLAKQERQAKRIAEAEAQAAYYRGLAESAQGSRQQPQQPSGPPKPDQFTNYDDYIEALTDYKVSEKLSKHQQASTANQRAASEIEYARRAAQKLEVSSSKYPDFEDVALSPDVPISPAMASAIAEFDTGADVAYYLGSNLNEAKRIAALSPASQIRELVLLESKLASKPQPTKTAAPIVPGSNRGAASKRMSDMNTDEFFDYRRNRLAKQRK